MSAHRQFDARAEEYRVALRRDFSTFAWACLAATTPAAFDALDGIGHEEAWHFEALCHAMTRIENGECKRLIITAPPRSYKSHCASIAFPAWAMGRNPNLRFLCASHGQDLSEGLARNFRAVVCHPFFSEAFPDFTIAKDASNELVTRKQGFRLATSIGGPVVGRGGDIWIIDDVHKPAEIYSDDRRDQVHQWFRETALSRLDSKADGAVILVMQRLHTDDLAGRLLATGEWEHLNLPAIAPHRMEIARGLGLVKIFEPGEYLQPQREGREVLERVRTDMGSIAFRAQFEQNPDDVTGSYVERAWLQSYPGPPDVRPGDMVLQSWDVASSEEDHADYSVCTTWRLRGAELHLLHVLRIKVTLPELTRRALRNAQDWEADRIVVETDGVGCSLFQHLYDAQRTQSGRRERQNTRAFSLRKPQGEPWAFAKIMIQGKRASGGKLDRLVGVTPLLEAGRVKLPEEAPWREGYIRELINFRGDGRGKDDQVDSTTMAIETMRGLLRA